MIFLKRNKVLYLFIILLITACNREEDSVLLKFLGDYRVNDACGYITTDYNMTVTVKSEENNELYLHNFGGYGTSISASVSADNPDKIIINAYSDNLHITGEGTINNERTRLVFTYETDNNGTSINCSSLADK